MVRPAKPFFLVKISKQDQKERINKSGMFYNPTEVYMTRNMQCGEIIAIGENAAKNFPQAQIGHTLIMHHFVEGDKETSKDVLVFEDETYNYYVVSAYSQAGHGSYAYGVWDGEKVIPHPEYLFLEPEAPPINDIDSESFLSQAMEETKGGLLVFKEYKIERESNAQTLERLKAEAMHLGKMRQTEETKIAIESKESEMAEITRKMNTPTFKPYTIAYSPSILNEWFDMEVGAGDTIFVQDNASTAVEFKDKIYLICENKYIGFMPSKN